MTGEIDRSNPIPRYSFWGCYLHLRCGLFCTNHRDQRGEEEDWASRQEGGDCWAIGNRHLLPVPTTHSLQYTILDKYWNKYWVNTG